MTELEEEALGTLDLVLDMLIQRKLHRETFFDLLSQVRKTKIRLENKQSGCPTGSHTGYCLCKPAVRGKAISGDEADALKARGF